jgi:hypothetical protein
VLAADPDGDLGGIGAVDLHRRPRRVAAAAADAFALVDLERRLAVDHRRPDRRDGAARHHCGTFADFGDEIMVGARRLRVLYVDRDVALAAAVDLAARAVMRSRLGVTSLMNSACIKSIRQLTTLGVGAGDVAMQPTLRARDHRHRISGAWS